MASELVSWSEETKRFALGPGIKVLRALHGPICVVAICGRARQGKSFLLNQLLAKLQGAQAAGCAGRGGGFAVGSTVKPCTKGGEFARLFD
ncbi:Interferon-induced guanylate-binding protein 2 [Tetrabaena socialis]|uniref:Interferon-induced guanylate-binding protein 2 n=1 Tax=Tetrabaena socialis TaxID=47790 RepID=A0A2J8AJB4_9CHLO|nr:Interferon-induced guanylate-binding protein 2 [Tetrabaena socialis]|eukprot:PNH12612.1 Interferon-induced guanylate-binding protein 2 [Tetrabaena socialis]